MRDNHKAVADKQGIMHFFTYGLRSVASILALAVSLSERLANPHRSEFGGSFRSLNPICAPWNSVTKVSRESSKFAETLILLGVFGRGGEI